MRSSAGPTVAVYNIEVEHEHEYFANGILCHNCDETRYALYTFINQADKPRELRLAEAIQGIDRSTREGITSSAIRYQQAQERMDAEEAPMPIGRLHRRLGMGMGRR